MLGSIAISIFGLYMACFNLLKRYLFRRSLRQETTQLNRQGEVKNYANSRFIGIWFDASNRDNFSIVNEYARKLISAGKKVELMGYVGKAKKEEKILFDYLSQKEVDWTGVPTPNTVEIWTEKPYDLLLCLHSKECRPLEYMAMLSQAKCRVGRYEESTINCYDLMVSLGDERSLPLMIKLVDQLLTEINKNQQQNAATV